eukprot:scaffold7537_cov403-Prasinococcus_capsulatus_cf.AAC.1
MRNTWRTNRETPFGRSAAGPPLAQTWPARHLGGCVHQRYGELKVCVPQRPRARQRNRQRIVCHPPTPEELDSTARDVDPMLLGVDVWLVVVAQPMGEIAALEDRTTVASVGNPQDAPKLRPDRTHPLRRLLRYAAIEWPSPSPGHGMSLACRMASAVHPSRVFWARVSRMISRSSCRKVRSKQLPTGQ